MKTMQSDTGGRPHLTRREFARRSAAGLGVLSLPGVGRPAAADVQSLDKGSGARPNILFVLVDQWRATATGYGGDPNVRTPVLDRLAATSLNFVNTVSVLPVCTPYRASLMTGRYPTSTGMFLNDAALPGGELCFAEMFGAAGYATAYIGKWHLDGHGRNAFVPPARRQGWDYWKGAECEHNYNRSHYYTGDSDEIQFWSGYDAYAQTADAQDYLRAAASRNRPFALMLSLGPPHFPHGTAPDDMKALYPSDGLRLPPNVPPAMQEKARAEAQGYYAHCTALDGCVGRLLDTLRETGLEENTILVFTSDHGEMMGSHGIRPWAKQAAYDESARVPFLLRHPRSHGDGGRAVRAPLTTPDILPTLLGLSGIPVPETVEGEDLSRIVRDAVDIPDRAALYMNVSPFGSAADGVLPYRAIRTARHTFVRQLGGPDLLFDDERDPHQMTNLADTPECKALKTELDARLRGELKKIGDDFREPQAYLDQWGYDVRPGQSVPYKPDSVPQSPRKRTGPGPRERSQQGEPS